MGTILEKEEIKKKKEEQEKQLISLTLTGLLMEGTSGHCRGRDHFYLLHRVPRAAAALSRTEAALLTSATPKKTKGAFVVGSKPQYA
jgi:hypothetical protein